MRFIKKKYRILQPVGLVESLMSKELLCSYLVNTVQFNILVHL